MEITQAEFISSHANIEKCPPPDKPEFAFIGRSNVGKSSLINMLTNRRSLAKTSVKPGKTQTINHFLINDSVRVWQDDRAVHPEAGKPVLSVYPH
jgi:GTP-binding protein